MPVKSNQNFILISIPVINAAIFLCGVDGNLLGAGGSFPGGG